LWKIIYNLRDPTSLRHPVTALFIRAAGREIVTHARTHALTHKHVHMYTLSFCRSLSLLQKIPLPKCRVHTTRRATNSHARAHTYSHTNTYTCKHFLFVAPSLSFKEYLFPTAVFIRTSGREIVCCLHGQGRRVQIIRKLQETHIHVIAAVCCSVFVAMRCSELQ